MVQFTVLPCICRWPREGSQTHQRYSLFLGALPDDEPYNDYTKSTGEFSKLSVIKP